MQFIEVCSGSGGLSTGFIQAGFEPLLLNEIDAVCCQTLELNHPSAAIHCGSMTNLLVQRAQPVGQIDLLMGGVPCQSFSQAGKRGGLDDPRGQLLVEFQRLVAVIRPRVFIIENVKGLLSHNHGETFQHVLRGLDELNDYVVQYKLLNALDYQVPQKRERVFIVGLRRPFSGSFMFPIARTPRLVLRDVLLTCPPSEGVQYSARKRAILDLVPEGGCWINLPLEIQQEYMGQSFHSSGGRRGMARRLSMDEPCLTLTTAPDQKQTERCHPSETRPLTVREYARVQTFPDTYQFCGTVRQQYKQIGNAVPVKLAYYLALEIKSFLERQ